MARFLIIDDHPLFREALHSAISLAYPGSCTQEAGSIGEAINIVSTAASFDLALLDLNVPDTEGYFGLLDLRARFPRLPVAVISGHEDNRIIRDVMNYGAAGFIPKSTRKKELTAAIKAIMNGAVFYPPGYEELPSADNNEERTVLLKKLASLTPQQLRVLNMLRDGLLNKQIAYELGVGETTIKAHVSEILRKLGVYSRTQAVIEAGRIDFTEILSEEARV